MGRTTCPECGNENALFFGIDGDPVHSYASCGVNGDDDCDWQRPPRIRDTGVAVRTGRNIDASRWYREHGYESMGTWVKDILQPKRYADTITVTDEAAAGVGWAEPSPPPLPDVLPEYHRTGTVYDNESTVMRNDVTEPLQVMFDTDAVLHEVRHQRSDYRTDLVYLDADPSGIAKREAMVSGDAFLYEHIERFKVWWWLYEHAPATWTDAVEHGQYTDKYTNKDALEWLLEHGYAARSTHDVVTPVMFPRIGALHAVELKISDWREAVEQAARANAAALSDTFKQAHDPRYQDRYGYADYRWVVLDAGAIRPALDNRDVFEDAGVGLIGVAENGSVVKHIDAEYDPRERYTRDRAWIESEMVAALHDNNDVHDILRSAESNSTGTGEQFSLNAY